MSVILITGSSTGIGFATTETLARSGYTVYATMRDPQRSPQLQQLADKDGLPITILPLDVLSDESVSSTINTVLAKEGYIDVLINNAGIHKWGAVEELSMDDFKENMETNYFGVLRCIKALLPSMRERKSGCIINNTSVAGKVYSNFHGAYAASKAAVEALSECLAQELVPYNIRVALVQAAFIETPVFNKSNEIAENTYYPNAKRFLSMFAAALEYHVPSAVAAEVIKDIVSGKSNAFRNLAGPHAGGFVNFRTSLADEDWINSVSVDDETWITGMEQMGLAVRKYMKAEGMPKFN